MLLPNSNMELEWIRNTLMVDTRARIIYHGVEPIFFDADEKWFINKYGLSGFILCAGRLSPIKNQLSLIRAAGDLKIPIVLIGPVNNRDYAVKCAREAQGRVKYIPPMNQKELASAYHAAGVHVQPSWFETAGLSSLEAAAAGTPVAITAWGAAREYLKDKAAYVEPDSLDSIRAGIIAALKQNTASGKLEEIKEYIKDRFTWDKAARDTLDAYKEVLAEDYEPESGGVFYTQTFPVSPKFYSD